MKRQSFGLMLLVLLLAPTSVWSQGSNPQIDAIRAQMQTLQAQLEALEKQPQKNSRVTQLGSSRLRSRNNEMVIRIYDLSDLFASAPAYPAASPDTIRDKDNYSLFPHPGGGIHQGSGFGGTGGFGGTVGTGQFGGSGGGFFSVPTSQTARVNGMKELASTTKKQNGDGVRTSVDNLINTITSTIYPEIWQANGGEATISQLGNTMVISADLTTHQQVNDLLNLLRQRWGTLRTVSVDAHWLWLTTEELHSVLKKKEGKIPFGAVDEAALAKLRQPKEKAQQAGYHAVVTCYNGQTVHTTSGGRSMMVTEMRPALLKTNDGDKAAQNRVVYRPQVKVLQDGAALQITPVSSLSAKYVLLDIHSRVSHIKRKIEQMEKLVEQAGLEPTPKQIIQSLDRPEIQLHELSTTLRLPVDQTMLVGGMTFSSEPKPGEANLYLFVNVSVQELRDDEEESEKLEPAKPEQKPEQINVQQSPLDE